MRHLPLLLVLSVIVATLAVGQTDSHDGSSDAHSGSELRSYVVTISEFRLADSTDPALSGADIVDAFHRMREEGTLHLVHTLRLAGVVDEESTAKFGSTIPVPVDVTVSADGASTRSVRWEDIGTIVHLIATARDGMVLLALSYETVGFRSERDDPETADRRMAKVETSLLLEPGTPVLAGGTSADGSCYLMVMIDGL